MSYLRKPQFVPVEPSLASRTAVNTARRNKLKVYEQSKIEKDENLENTEKPHIFSVKPPKKTRTATSIAREKRMDREKRKNLENNKKKYLINERKKLYIKQINSQKCANSISLQKNKEIIKQQSLEKKRMIEWRRNRLLNKEHDLKEVVKVQKIEKAIHNINNSIDEKNQRIKIQNEITRLSKDGLKQNYKKLQQLESAFPLYERVFTHGLQKQ